ncbi:hypothetical protein DMY87_19820 [Rhizobium wuzhouense]|uniref:Uncharacterized protein n=1 Tax=Rhizobium wuzhouense TaxID=1986026 RepID=A0ABX5NNJ2_9HYPH|nr:hypothetical protein DMY87_19820 [Rhizobium wuzhouense]
MRQVRKEFKIIWIVDKVDGSEAVEIEMECGWQPVWFLDAIHPISRLHVIEEAKDCEVGHSIGP